MDALVVAFGVVFVAELADKSQLTTLAFAARYPARTVLAAISLAALLINAASVLVGAVVAAALPTRAIDLGAGLLFLGFAIWTLRAPGPPEAGAAVPSRTGRWAIVAIGTTFILAELGDKTMLATATLAATQAAIPTWLGAAAGEIAADAIAIGIGATLGARLPERAIRLFAALAFVAFGAVLIAESLGLL